MVEVKKTRGRPRKDKPVENPDCAPATKGYVKCQIRHLIRISNHEHDLGGDNIVAAIGITTILGFCITGVVFMFIAGKPELSWWCSVVTSTMIVFGSLAVACVVSDMKTDSAMINDGDISPAFEKYEPPVVCTPKRGCE